MEDPGDALNVSNGVTVVVVTGGPLDAAVSDPRLDVERLAGAVVIAADSGVDRARAAGWPVHRVVGDLDSATPDGLAWARAGGAVVEAHEPDKDATDLELAVDAALALAPDRLLVVGSNGGRLDLQLADLLLLAGPALADIEVTAWFGPATVTVVRPGRPRRLAGGELDLVSLLPIHGPATGVQTTGLHWALRDATLVSGTTRGASNQLVDTA
ncbi:MAG TPA: thiamine diphosphokinase, partial [Acidimicrobiales bacterium]